MTLDSALEWAALIARTVKPWDVPRVLIDSDGVRSGARDIATQTGAVEQATANVLRAWQHLPTSLKAPGAVEPLYEAMAQPARLGTALGSTASAVQGALERLADVVDDHGPTLQHLRAEVEQLNEEVAADAATATRLTGIVLDFRLPLMVARADDLRHRVTAAASAWHEAVGAVATRLGDIRAGLDPDLLVGGTTAATPGLHGPSDHDPSRADFDLLTEWATGAGPRHHVFTAEDPFTRLVRRTDTVQADVGSARDLLSRGGWHYGEPLDPGDDQTFGRSVGGVQGVKIFAHDLNTWLDHLGGGSSGNMADTFMGSYAVSIVPIAAVGPRSVRVQFTVTNATTLASGTRAPVLGYKGLSGTIDEIKNDSVPTGPGSETTQTITWTQVISWPAKDGIRKTRTAP